MSNYRAPCFYRIYFVAIPSYIELPWIDEIIMLRKFVPNLRNGEQSKSKEFRKRRSLEGADAPSKNTKPTKKPRI